MRIITAWANNFASYKHIAFDFQNQGLTLIQGNTGAGKSTICDLVPWILFGQTAKGGAVSEILSWPGDGITAATVQLDTAMTVTRIRGPKAKDNDLYYNFSDTAHYREGGVRGKDMPDTQRLINQLLGFDYALYLAGAYYHEFSETAQFFTTTAKSRRAICEQLVDLTLAKKLQARLLDEYKTANKHKDTFTQQSRQLTASIDTLKSVHIVAERRRLAWNNEHVCAYDDTILRLEMFEANRKKTISKTCPTCSTVLVKSHTHIDDSANPYVAKLEAIEAEVNPHTASTQDHAKEIAEKQVILYNYEVEVTNCISELADIELLQQVTNDYRSVSISNTIADVETRTNRLLTDHFDAEIRTGFEVADADKLDVTIYKDGNLASFSQLSKGQRCMLNLCFSISVMQAVQNHHGITFNQLFLDEAFSGLSEALKIKAVRMLETILEERGSIFIIEHSEAVRAFIDNQYSVSLVNGGSQIERI